MAAGWVPGVRVGAVPVAQCQAAVHIASCSIDAPTPLGQEASAGARGEVMGLELQSPAAGTWIVLTWRVPSK